VNPAASRLVESRGRWGYAAAILVLCLVQLRVGWEIAGQINHNPDEFDQGAYIQMAQRMQSSWYPWYPDGTRNPLLPWLAARFLDPSAPDFLEKAKLFNVVLGALGTGILGWFFGRRMGPLAAWNATAISALAVVLPTSTFFGAETLFFVLFLLLFACGMRLLTQNPLGLYAAFGVFAAAAYLTKPSATPFLALFFFFSLLRLLSTRLPLPALWSAPDWRPRNLLVGVVIFSALYGVLISPRLQYAQRTWGSAFYSLPSFWFWADDWESCVNKYTDCRKETIARMPPAERPTLQGYFLRHSPSDAALRLANGTGLRLRQLFHPEKRWRFPAEKKGDLRRAVLPNRGFYLIGAAALALAMGAFAWRAGVLSAPGPVGLPLLLFAATFALYALATGWYVPTGPGHRFILTLYLPTLWICAQGSEQLRSVARSRIADGTFLAIHAALAILLACRLVMLAAGPSFEKIAYTF